MRTLLITLLLLGGACNDSPPARQQAPAITAPVDLDTATEKQLEALPGIGPKHAKSIIASRNARGGHFKSVDDLLSIDGIGPKTLDALRPYVFVGKRW